jgi:hypothetical protein
MTPNKNKNKNTRRRRKRTKTRRPNHPAPSHKTRSSIGEQIGGALGNMAQKGLGKLFGFGEYHAALANEIGHPAESIITSKTPESNSLVEPLSTNDLVPIMHEGSEGSIVVTRREYIRQIAISTADQVLAIEINPGYQAAFPWLHKLARNFQQFRFLGFAAEFVPLSGYAVSSDSATLGQVAFAFAYNVISEGGAADWPVTSYPGILNMEGAVTGTPATPMSCYMECDPEKSNQLNRFVYLGATPQYAYSYQNLDCATLVSRAGGSQNLIAALAGQLWFTYEIVLHQPRPQDPVASLDLGDFGEVLREFQELKEFCAPLTDLQAIAFEERRLELRAILSSVTFREHFARAQAKAKRRALLVKTTLPEISPLVLRIIEREENREDILPPPPPSPARANRSIHDTYPPGTKHSNPVPVPLRLSRS